MTDAGALLPAGFEALEPYAESWAVSGANNRLRLRLDSGAAERVAFFNAASEVVAPALAYLDRKPLAQFDAAERRLMNLLLSFAHIALAVETQGDDEPKHRLGALHMHITCAPSDICV